MGPKKSTKKELILGKYLQETPARFSAEGLSDQLQDLRVEVHVVLLILD